MTQVPASSHGGGLPSQWTVDDNGALLITLTGASGDHAFAHGLRLFNSDGSAIFSVDSSGDMNNQVVDNDSEGLSISFPGNISSRITSPSNGRGLILNALAAPTDGALAVGDGAIWIDRTAAGPALGFKGRATGNAIASSKYPLRQSAGALPTVAPVTATAFQCSVTQDVVLVVPVTYNPGAATTATCLVQVSPDNVTFSTLFTITQPVGTVFDGSIEPLTLLVPAAWYVKLTVTNATLGTGTYY